LNCYEQHFLFSHGLGLQKKQNSNKKITKKSSNKKELQHNNKGLLKKVVVEVRVMRQ